MTATLLITPALGSAIVSAADEACQTRDQLLHQAGLVTTVTDRIDADDATAVLRSLKAFVSTIETQRKLAKEPALDIGRKIDALAKELAAKVEAEAARISRILGAFEVEERRKADEARYAAEMEAQRIARDAEAERLKALRAYTTAEAKDRASDAIVEKAQAEIVAVRQAAANAAPPKTENSTLRQDVCFEVTDIKALYADSPHLVTLEPNGSAIRAILKANPNLKLPGLRYWFEAKLNVRA